MLYSHEPVLPIDVDHELADCILNLDYPEFEELDFHAALLKLKILQDAVFQKAEANIEQAQAKQQADFAKRRYKQKNFIVGNKALRYNLRRADRKEGKQTDLWDGPYEVAQVCEKGQYSLIHPSTKVPPQD